MNRQATSESGKEIQTLRPARALTPIEEMDRMFESFFPRGWLRPFRGQWPVSGEALPFEGRMPCVDVIDRDDEVVLRAEVPGVNKDDMEVTVSDNAVTLKAEARREQKEEKGDYYRHEISHGAFARTVALPDYVNPEAAKAKFEDGVLEVKIPKLEKAKRRTLKID